jgi:hypothetical protein
MSINSAEELNVPLLGEYTDAYDRERSAVGRDVFVDTEPRVSVSFSQC